ncbi:hypothetical protein Cantr_01379 [Candida viswanathii]|uniref:Cell wall protein RHD3 n=1 Tax=Candida viswanathii TaxID=5486 RepID=A0A367YIE7_9ASCO|nr:hypothetical protein Cantr_01379 [Candida viswanathii]
MKLSFAANLFFAVSAFASIGLQVQLLESHNRQWVCVPDDGNSSRLYLGNYQWEPMFLEATFNQDGNYSTLWWGQGDQPKKYVSVDSDGFLVLGDEQYHFDGKVQGGVGHKFIVDDSDKFAIVETESGDSVAYKVIVGDKAPTGSSPVSLELEFVTMLVKRDQPTAAPIPVTSVELI